MLQSAVLRVPAQGNGAQTDGGTSSKFAQLIHQITNESARQVPAATASSRLSPARTKLPAVIPGKSASDQAEENSTPLAAALTVPMPTPPPTKLTLPGFPADDCEAMSKRPRQPVEQKMDESAPQTEMPAKQKEKAQFMVASEGPHSQQKPAPIKAAQAAALFAITVAVPMPVPTPIRLKLPSFAAQPDEAVQTSAPATAPVKREQTPDLGPAAALELKIKTQDQPAEVPVEQVTQRVAPASKPAKSADEPAADSVPDVTPRVQSRAEQIIHAAVSLPGERTPESAPVQPIRTSAVVTVATPQATFTNATGAKMEPSPNPTAHLEEPLPDQPKQQAQPLRSISIEFTPDGAQDVRLRLAERAGDVHISLHSTDPVLTGRLSEGVHDLVGTLVSAGYDAQAWTPNQGRQNQRQSEDPRRNRRTNPTEAGTEEFGAVMQQPIESNP